MSNEDDTNPRPISLFDGGLMTFKCTNKFIFFSTHCLVNGFRMGKLSFLFNTLLEKEIFMCWLITSSIACNLSVPHWTIINHSVAQSTQPIWWIMTSLLAQQHEHNASKCNSYLQLVALGEQLNYLAMHSTSRGHLDTHPHDERSKGSVSTE